ncbi:MAG: hypothetical protein BIFFINMI_02006 [Phycisphaerae bacterium]|nr:hypothetical protein [Phycisphaerae bacterium]MCG3179665.1 hypothetical protein [Phycisphaerae bacterium]
MNRTLLCSLIVVVLALLIVPALCGCNTVYVRGDAATALETSAIHAQVAADRAQYSSPPPPAWVSEYLAENAKQWRAFVTSARRYQWQAPTTQPE